MLGLNLFANVNRVQIPFRQKLALVLTATLFLTSCSSVVLRQVDEENRDTSGRFDGGYEVTERKAPLKQSIQKWIFTCNGFGEERKQTASVKDGKLSFYRGSLLVTAFVSPEGKFRAEVPLPGVAKERAGSFSAITKGDRELVVQGSLKTEGSSSGAMTWGIEQFANSGCSRGLSIIRKG